MRASVPLLLTLLFTVACSSPSDEGSSVGTSAPGAVSESSYFVDRTEESGLDFVHDNGMTGTFHMAEISGSGAALLDYDLDGDLDLYLVQSGPLPPKDGDRDRDGDGDGDGVGRDRLYRNDLVERGTLGFTDVTASAGELGTGYGMGASVGDFDNDGFPDLYVTALDDNQLLRNRGDGTFQDVTEDSGTAEGRWSVPSAFFDFDSDGSLDLFIGNYLSFGDEAPVCRDFSGNPDYCGPESHPPLADRLLRNAGSGRFDDVSSRLSFATRRGDRGHEAPALGVVVSDFDGNGELDFYVTNDGRNNHLFMQEQGRFVDRALLSGSAVNAEGRSEASMGVDLADVDRDGDLDLFMTHLVSETNTLFLNDGTGQFDDQTLRMKLAAPSRLHTAFGTGFVDFDLDGYSDLLVANGAVRKIEALVHEQDPFPFHEPNQLFRNLAGTGFEEVALARSGPAFESSEVSRGVALGDLDNDGDVDLLISNNHARARLLLGTASDSAQWLGVRTARRVEDGLRDEPGTIAVLRARTAAGAPVSRLERSRIEGSYASSNDPRIVFALRELVGPFTVEVRWPDGSVEVFDGVAANAYNTLVRGEGLALNGGDS